MLRVSQLTGGPPFSLPSLYGGRPPVSFDYHHIGVNQQGLNHFSFQNTLDGEWNDECLGRAHYHIYINKTRYIRYNVGNQSLKWQHDPLHWEVN